MAEKPKICTVRKTGPVYRVMDHDGVPANGERAPADGGGFRDKRDAEHLAATINARREAKL